jgi:hypothetical protein
MKKFNLLSLVGTIIFLQTSIAQINLAHAESPLHDKVLEAIDDPSAKSLSKLQQASVIAAIRQAGVGELAGFLESVDSSPWSPPLRIELQSLAITECGKIDPKKTLDQAFPKIYDFEGDVRKKTVTVFGKWAWQKPDEAEAWLDLQITNKNFRGPAADGQDRPRNGLEGQMCQALATWNKLGRLDKRLSQTPQELKNSMGSLITPVIRKENVAAFFELANKHFQDDIVKGLLVKLVMLRMREQDLAAASSVLDNANLPKKFNSSAAESGSTSWILTSSLKGVVSAEEFTKVLNWTKQYTDTDYSSTAGLLLDLIAVTPRPGKFKEVFAILNSMKDDPLYEKIIVSLISWLHNDSHKLQCKPLLASMKDPELLKKATEMIDKASKSQ